VDADGTVRVRSRYIAFFPTAAFTTGVLRHLSGPHRRLADQLSHVGAEISRVECIELPDSFVELWRPSADRLPEILP